MSRRTCQKFLIAFNEMLKLQMNVAELSGVICIWMYVSDKEN